MEVSAQVWFFTSYERLGFRQYSRETDTTIYYVFTEAYKQRFCKGFNQRIVTKLLLEKGWLLIGSDGGSSQSIRLPGIGTTRCYVFSAESWEN
jgi:putative DNA primase/helicase